MSICIFFHIDKPIVAYHFFGICLSLNSVQGILGVCYKPNLLQTVKYNSSILKMGHTMIWKMHRKMLDYAYCFMTFNGHYCECVFVLTILGQLYAKLSLY